MLLSSLDHLVWWAAEACQNQYTNKNMYTSIDFGNTNSKARFEQCIQSITEPYRSRVLNVLELAEKLKNYKWLKRFANQDKHRFTNVFEDMSSLTSVKIYLLETADFISQSINFVKEGTPFSSDLSGEVNLTNRKSTQPNVKLLNMLIRERIGFAEKSIRKLENALHEHLDASRSLVQIREEMNSEGRPLWIFSTNNIPIPIKWRIDTGLIAHVLRSVLDHMVWALVIHNGKTPTSRNKFPIPDPDYDFDNLSRSPDNTRKQMLKHLSDDDKQKIETMLHPLHKTMGGVFANLISLKSLRNTDAHQHVPIAISAQSGMSDEWYSKANEACDLGTSPPKPTVSDVKLIASFCDRAPVGHSKHYGGDIIQSCYEFMTAVKSVAEYLNFDVRTAK